MNVRKIEISSVIGRQADPDIRRKTRHQPGQIGDEFTERVRRTLQLLGWSPDATVPQHISRSVVNLLRQGIHPVEVMTMTKLKYIEPDQLALIEPPSPDKYCSE
jgi:hypothetical protein